jgi:hypothetical protein
MSLGPGISDAAFDNFTAFVAALACPSCGARGDVEIDAPREHRRCRGCGHVFTEAEWKAACDAAESSK